MNKEAYSLTWENLALWRGERCLQQGLAGEVSAGSAVCLRGPNGCGKTTLLRTLCGLSEPETGVIRWRGETLAEARSDYHAELAYAGHRAGLKDDLTTRESLRFAAALEGGSPDIPALLQGLGLIRCADLPARNLSAGQRRRAALARVMGSGKRLWVLDEPYSNLDPEGRRWLTARFAEHLEAGG
ncbi:MAG: heme ABC exporter ATP-binding protein CcmA, partial [Gammaproteobacteria bacterium]|nr:heme ABC exporter ATP-binding protein CcmA [Gammaproteobacteria bacterium]